METVTDKKTSSVAVKKLKIAANKQKAREEDRAKALFQQIVRSIKTYIKMPDTDLLKRAFVFASEAHEHHVRLSGHPYIVHCLETAKILTELRMDPVTVAAGILHDVVEDTGIDIEAVRSAFGGEIALLVDGVTKISELKFQSQAEKQAENFRKLIFFMARDLRVILIKLSDRLHNMRTIQFLSEKDAQRLSRETLDIYVSLADRFGIARIKRELEDLCFHVLNREEYEIIKRRINLDDEGLERIKIKASKVLRAKLTQNKINATIKGRVKGIYSIYKKINERGVPFDEINDLVAIRIIVDNEQECYSLLGLVHDIFTPLTPE